MSNPNPAPAAEQQPEFTQAQMDTAIASAKSEGQTAGETAERERFAALAELDGGSKVSAELSAAMADGTSVVDFALAQARAGKAKVGAALDAARSEAVATGDLPATDANAGKPGGKGPVNRGQAFVDARAARQAAAKPA